MYILVDVTPLTPVVLVPFVVVNIYLLIIFVLFNNFIILLIEKPIINRKRYDRLCILID